MTTKIVLDTNMLIYIGKHKFDIFSELERICNFSYKIYVLDGSLQELEKLINKGSLSVKRLARLALKIIRAKKVFIIKTESNKTVDENLTNLPAEDTFVVTQDKALKKLLKEKHIKILTLRQRKLLFEE